MFHHLGLPVLAADLDPQANLTSAFLDERKLETLWNAAMTDPREPTNLIPSREMAGAARRPVRL